MHSILSVEKSSISSLLTYGQRLDLIARLIRLMSRSGRGGFPGTLGMQREHCNFWNRRAYGKSLTLSCHLILCCPQVPWVSLPHFPISSMVTSPWRGFYVVTRVSNLSSLLVSCLFYLGQRHWLETFLNGWTYHLGFG